MSAIHLRAYMKELVPIKLTRTHVSARRDSVGKTARLMLTSACLAPARTKAPVQIRPRLLLSQRTRSIASVQRDGQLTSARSILTSVLALLAATVGCALTQSPRPQSVHISVIVLTMDTLATTVL